MKVFIWGTGKKVSDVISALSSETEILGFIDNDEKQQQHTIMDKNVYSPDIVYIQPFDYVIISSRVKYKEISDQLETMGIDKEKIIQFFNYTRFFPRTFFYNDAIVKENRYNLLFENYVDTQIAEQNVNLAVVEDKMLYEKLNEYYDRKENFRKGNQLRVLELVYMGYLTGDNIYDSSKYSFVYELANLRTPDKILEKIYCFKPDIIMTHDSTAHARNIFNHRNILYINNNDHSSHIYLTKKKNYPINEIVLFFHREEIIQQVCNENGNSNHIVQWNYVEDANFLDSEIKITDKFQTDILIAASSNSSLFKMKRYIKSFCMPLWMLGSNSVKDDFLKALDMMIDELYQRMDMTGILIDDEKEYVDIFYEIVSRNNLKLDFIKEISCEDIEYFHKHLRSTVVEPIFRFLIAKWVIDRGYNVALWGDAWKEEETTKEYYKGTIKNREEMKQTYNKAKICLFTNPDLCIHYSVFEIIGSKSLCLAYENEKVCCSTSLSKYFEDGKSIALFHSREELYEKIDYYLNNIEHRKRIIEEGNKIMMENKICWENELSKAVHQAVKQAEENGMFQ